jgi:hypothetical protein
MTRKAVKAASASTPAEPTFNVRLVSGTTYRDIPPVTPEEEIKYPFVLYGNFRQPSFMEVTWALLYGGSEEFTIRGDTVETLQDFAAYNGFPTHPRLRRLQISDNSKVVWSLVPGQGWKAGDVTR